MEKRPKRSRRIPLVHDTLPTLQWWGRTESKSLGRGRCGAEKINLQRSQQNEFKEKEGTPGFSYLCGS